MGNDVSTYLTKKLMNQAKDIFGFKRTLTIAERDAKGEISINASPWPRAAISSATDPPILCPINTTDFLETPNPNFNGNHIWL